MTNQVLLRGRIGRDPIIKEKLTVLSVATKRNWKDQAGEWKEATTWHSIKIFDILPRVPQKGEEVYVEGELANNNWEKSDGTKVYEYFVKARSIKVVESETTRKQEEVEEVSGHEDLDSICPF